MCGRYSLAVDDFSQIRLGVNLELFSARWSRRYNIAPSYSPGHEPAIVRLADSGRARVSLVRWWLIPRWWQKPLSELPTSFNARSEDIEKKPLWREPMAERRCLVPATGWREFVGPAGHKRAFHFQRGEPFAFAGVWDRWRSPEGERVESFAIITAPASLLVRPIHDRMPLVMPTDLQARWLLPESDHRVVLSKAIERRQEQLELFECSSYGNSVRHEGPECIARVAVQGELF